MTRIRLSREFVAEGFHHDELTQMTRRNELVHIRRGAYAEPATEEPDPRAAHRQLIEATIRQSSTEAVASYVSAAVLHGLPIWNDSLSRVHLSRDRSAGGRRRRYSEIHNASLPERDVVIVDGMRVTSLARTVVDLACALPMDRAVAAGDAALRLDADPAELVELLEEGLGRRGIGQARRTIAFLDPRSESAGESVSRVQFHRYGVPKPDLQHDVFGPDGGFVGRSDFWWEQYNTLGEFDGKIKYGRALKPGQPVEEVLFEEKRREDKMREEHEMARWIWADLYPPTRLLVRLRRAFDRGGRQRRTAAT